MLRPLRRSRSRDVKRRTRRFPCWLLALAFLPSSAGAAGEEQDLDRWVPAFAVFFDMLGQKGEGEITTNEVQGPPLGEGGCTVTDLFGTRQTGILCPDSEAQLTPPTEDDDTSITPLVGGSLELSTPRLIPSFLSPRLFARAELSGAFGFERNLAGERKPGRFFTDPLKPIEFDVFERSVNGQGSRAKMQVGPIVIGAGAGVAFTTTIFGRTTRVKPSFEYLWQEVDLIASVRRAVKQVDPADNLDDFRLIALEHNDTETLHGLGAGLELEVDTGRLGPIVVSMFLNGKYYRYTGNLRHTFTETNEFNESATWRFELDPSAWRAGVGARFRWSPEE